MYKNNQAGFTILELTLAMTFLVFVLVFSATIVVQLTQTYSKGLTIKQINQAGRTITDDLSRSIQGSASEDIKTSYVGNGVLCVGESAYIWNPVYRQDNTFNAAGINRFQIGSQPVSLARVLASDVGDCILPPGNTVNIVAGVDQVSLLSGQARVINAYAEPIQTSGGKLVNMRFLLGTYDPSENAAMGVAADLSQVTNSVYFDPSLAPSGQYTCRPDRLGNFCAFAEFETTVYVSR